ncbi:hypothetical protein Sango_1174200 [Sesamum angolense]|uniref:GPI transamidase subunit PIG-U n=1 Tax=Sesamum angolense TaxID=2727404 RepID=A0AAE1WWG4_9LAMI|nr:hypothetical protein Sango_1174200 [Sesamum angolense]
MEEKPQIRSNTKKLGFWKWAIASVVFRLVLSYFSKNLNLSSRPEVSTPLTSLRRLAEGYWLKRLSMSPYSEILPSGDIAALVYLWNPFTIVSCVGFNTSPIENLFVILSLYGASAGLIPLAAFGWVIASHLSLYPLVLIIPVGDSALYLSLLVLFVNELAEMQFSFFLFCGYVGVSLLSPVMHNLWIWRGTGNANFYFATAIAYACFQIVLVVESVSAMLNYDRKIRKLCHTAKV